MFPLNLKNTIWVVFAIFKQIHKMSFDELNDRWPWTWQFPSVSNLSIFWGYKMFPEFTPQPLALGTVPVASQREWKEARRIPH